VPVLASTRIANLGVKHIRHGKGAFAGEPFVLEPWQLECTQANYDPINPDGTRRVREALVGIPKKNGKTSWAAMLGCYGAFADGRYVRERGSWVWRDEVGAEVYNVAGSKEQASILFRIARSYVERSPLLRSMSRVYRDAIEIPERDAVWRVLAADGKLVHGPNPSTTIIDEIWVHKNPDLYEAFASAGATREQPLVITITTAGFEQTSIAWRLYQRGKRSRSPRFSSAGTRRRRARSSTTPRPCGPRTPRAG
jgi:phage terminase large subunit-like protein